MIKWIQNILFICILSVCIPSDAQASAVQVKSINTSYGQKIYFENLKEDFEISYAEGVLTLLFSDVYQFENLKALTKEGTKIKSVQPVGRILNMVFDDKDVRIEKISSTSNQYGVNIYYNNKVEESDAVKSPVDTKPTIYKLPVYKSQTDKSLKYTFDWNTQSGASVFRRGGKVWVVFNKLSDISLSNQIGAKEITKVSSSNASIIKIKPSEESNKYKNVLMYNEGNKWILEFSNSSIKPKPIRVLSRPYAAPQPRVELEFSEDNTTVLNVRDDDVGDDLVVVTTSEGATNVGTEYKFVDFTIMQSIHGAVIQKLSDSLSFQRQKNIVSIEGANALNIAPKVLRKSQNKAEDVGVEFKLDSFVTGNLSILSIKSYKVEDAEFFNRMYEIRSLLAQSTSKEKRSNVLANWALFYLANELYVEGLTIIHLLRQEDPEFSDGYNIRFIEAVLNFMNKSYLNAYKLIRKVDILDVPISLRKEVRYWQAIIGYMVSDFEDSLSQIDPASIYLQDTNSFLSEYTQPFLVEFGFAIATNKLHGRLYADAKQVINRMSKYELHGHDGNHLLDITGLYYSKIDQPDKAIESWDKCIEDVSDSLNNALCRFDKVQYMEQTSRITKQDYVNELEGLAAIWRGDELEVKVLQNLGDTYLELKDYINALRSWQKVVEYFAYSPEALTLSRKMGETFVDFFLKGRDEDVNHLQAAAIFYEFENLNPIGEVGDEVALKFVGHLVSLDLLNRATALLNHQIMYRLRGNKKEKAINLLAKLYMRNQEPALAIDAINLGDLYEELPDYIGLERKYLHAEAFCANREYDKALEMLAGNFAQDADDIRANIYWTIHEWRDFNKSVEPRIYKIRDAEGEVTSDDSDKILKLAISYLILDEQKLLKDLIHDFKGRLPQENLKADIMRLLAQTWSAINDTSLTALKDKTTIEEKVLELLNLLSLDKPAL